MSDDWYERFWDVARALGMPGTPHWTEVISKVRELREKLVNLRSQMIAQAKHDQDEIARLKHELTFSVDVSGFGKMTAEKVESLLKDMGAIQPMVLIAHDGKRGVAVRLADTLDEWFKDDILVVWDNGSVGGLYDYSRSYQIRPDTELRFYGMLTRD